MEFEKKISINIQYQYSTREDANKEHAMHVCIYVCV